MKTITNRQTTKLFRPEWTCGKYNVAHKAAILYNLLEGICIYYEGVSAEVIGCILSFERSKPFDLADLSQKSDVKVSCLEPFVEQMEHFGLLTRRKFSKNDIAQYREKLKAVRRNLTVDHTENLHDLGVVSTANAERLYMEKVGGITSVMLELTYRCSERCIHCFNAGATRNISKTSNRGNRQELNISEYKKLIDELDGMGIAKACLSGGDPFSNSSVWDIIDYLYQKEIAIDVFTNGLGVVNQVERLAGYYPRTLGISLYSDIPSVHDSITGVKGSHDKTILFIEHCSEYAIPMLLKCCIMKPNVSSYYTVKDVALRYGALPQFDVNITDSVEGDKCASTYLRLGKEELEIILRDKDLPYYINGDGVKHTVHNGNDLMCNAGINSLCITPEGNVQPCCTFPLKVGNIRSTRLSNILKDSDQLNWWKKQTIKDCEDCHKHPYCTYCQMCVGKIILHTETHWLHQRTTVSLPKCDMNLL